MRGGERGGRKEKESMAIGPFQAEAARQKRGWSWGGCRVAGGNGEERGGPGRGVGQCGGAATAGSCSAAACVGIAAWPCCAFGRVGEGRRD
jgi:hypothetical protein